MQTRLSGAESRRMRPDLESAIEHLPGLASRALWCLFADANDDEESIAYTGDGTIYAGAPYEKFSAKERKFICLHKILHFALCHPQRGEQLRRRDLSSNAELLNIAADAIINSSLENLTGLEAPSDAWTLAKNWQTLDDHVTEKEKAANQANLPASASNVITLQYPYGAQSQSKKIANLTRAEFASANRWSYEELYYFLKAQAQTRAKFLACLIAAYGKDSLGGDLREPGLRKAKKRPSTRERLTQKPTMRRQRAKNANGSSVPRSFEKLCRSFSSVSPENCQKWKCFGSKFFVRLCRRLFKK